MKIYKEFELALKSYKIEYISKFKDGKEVFLKDFLGKNFKHNFRCDFGIYKANELCLIVEIEGATWSSGRHNRGKGFHNDILKYNIITCKMPLLRFTSYMVSEHPIKIAEFINKYIQNEICDVYLNEFMNFFKLK